MSNLIKGNKCLEEGATKQDLLTKIDKIGGHDMKIGWHDLADNGPYVPYMQIDNNPSNFFLVSSDNHAIKFNVTENGIEVIVDGQILGKMSMYE